VGSGSDIRRSKAKLVDTVGEYPTEPYSSRAISPHHSVPETAEIAVDGADDLYREIRIENKLTDEDGNAVKLKEGGPVETGHQKRDCDRQKQEKLNFLSGREDCACARDQRLQVLIFGKNGANADIESRLLRCVRGMSR
jgi:hypothetical protein